MRKPVLKECENGDGEMDWEEYDEWCGAYADDARDEYKDEG